MRVRLIVVGKKVPAWVQTGYQEYARRLPRELTLEIIEIPLAHRGKNVDLVRQLQKEGTAMLAAVKQNDFVISLDVNGESWSSDALAKQLLDWQLLGTDVCLLVGGPDGLAPDCIKRSQLQWSISKLTLPHPLVRVVVAEALYRAWSINIGHPYHRE